ncbi:MULTISPECIES: hypothetical protein [Niastella]|uniref:DUF3828 domain-containing protein n=1 Tax=Niastella soli TaxID=2821487 RepID=A0ABS3YPL5_9BACT|nr:hypothetical protein [Niastella soli]MBO9199831.1 hypothetical protein [Niastella soli]
MCKVTPMLLALLLSLSAGAQGVFVNETNTALKMVIEDYPNHFSNIKGDPIATPEPAINYKSKVIIPGSVNCMLTESKTNAVYSWKSELFSTTDFQNAKERFSSLYKEIHNTIIKLAGEKPSILNGQYEDPDKNRKQTTIHFHFLPNTGLIQKLHVELQLRSEGGTWKIMLQVFDEAPAARSNMQTMA